MPRKGIATMALCLTLKVGERVQIGPEIRVTVVEFKGGRTVNLRFEAPDSVVILSDRVREKINRDGIRPKGWRPRDGR
jgi:carbon storage regulator CsrA